MGVCTRCGVVWPTVPCGARVVPVVHADGAMADHLADAATALSGGLAELARRWTAGERSRWQDALWTYGPAQLGALLEPPVAQPDQSWVTAFLDDLDALPDGPVLLLGGALGGEALVLPAAWHGSRDVVVLESHPWLVAASGALLAAEPSLGVLRRPGVLEARPLALPPAARQVLSAVRVVLGDAHDPPFEAGAFAAIVALNVVDSVADPWTVMQQCEALLRPGGALLLSAPWQGDDAVTPADRRLDAGLPADADVPWQVACRVTGAAIPGVLDGLALQHLERGLAWPLRVHDRLTWRYEVDALLLRRV